MQLPAHIISDVLEDDEEVLKIEAEIAENVSEENEIPDVEIVAVANDDSPQKIAKYNQKIIAATEIGTGVHDGMTAAVPTESIEKPKPTKVSVQIEDYGGGFGFPHYGVRRPSSDYYNSNLILLEKKMLKLEVKGPSEKQQKA